MSTKHDDSCLAKAGDDEPIFVLRAQDELAPDIVDEWATRVNMCYAMAPPSVRASIELKIQEARDLADAMRAWQKAHGSKVPD